ncbi:MAG: ABC transporter substrate-binding protein [Phycisphaerales bacterium]|nr:ABC transporter substrate-binding protein [Phycisphaerales bacterium]
MRVVSLLPSATETLCLVGGSGLLVGRSHECDYPPGIAHLPVLTGPAAALGDAPGEIDRAVRARGGADPGSDQSPPPLYRLDADLLASLHPDLILTQDLCHVCSIDLRAVRAVAARLSPSPRVLSLNPRTVEGVLDDVLTIGRAIGHDAQATAAVVALRDRLSRASDHVNPYVDGPVVAFLEWTDPLFVGGHWVPQLVERAGGRHPLNPTVAAEGSGSASGPQAAFRTAGPSVTVPPEVLVATRPERIVISPCGRTLDQARGDAAALARQPWWRDLPAVRAGHVALVDGNQMFSRPGPRLVDAFEWLVGWLNERPDLVPPGFPWELMTPGGNASLPAG